MGELDKTIKKIDEKFEDTVKKMDKKFNEGIIKKKGVVIKIK